MKILEYQIYFKSIIKIFYEQCNNKIAKMNGENNIWKIKSMII